MTGFAAAALTDVADVSPFDLDLSFDTGQDIVERDFEAGFNVVSSFGASARSSGSRGSEDGASEDIVEHAEDILKAHVGEIVHGGPAESLMAVLVVALSFFGIGENFIGFGALFELCFGFLVVGVFIGMVLECLAAIGALDIVGGTVAVDAEYLVIVTFGGCGHNEPLESSAVSKNTYNIHTNEWHGQASLVHDNRS